MCRSKGPASITIAFPQAQVKLVIGTTMPVEGGVLAGRNAAPQPVAEPAAA